MASAPYWWIPNGTSSTPDVGQPPLSTANAYALPNGQVGVPYNYNLFPPQANPQTCEQADLFLCQAFSPTTQQELNDAGMDLGGLGLAPAFYFDGVGAPVAPLPIPSDISSAGWNDYWQVAFTPLIAGTYYIKIEQWFDSPCISERVFKITILDSKKKPRRISAPPTICCEFPNGNCPSQVNMRGNVYQNIQGTNCYILKRR